MKLTKALKFRVHSPEHSKAIQERLFELGASWTGEKQTVIETEAPYLYYAAFRSNEIEFGLYDVTFTNDTAQEATLDDLYNPEFLKPEEACEAKSIVIDGKKYKLVLDE